jgi:imidazolonepropionase
LAAKLGANSADHLMAVFEKLIERMAAKKVVATMLPGTTIFLGKQSFAPVRDMITKGVRVAIASDYNPGSCVFNSQPLMMNFAMMYGKLTLDEAFMGVTRNAALSLNRKKIGMIEEGAEADLIVWKFDDISQIPYQNTESAQFITHTIKKGKIFDRQPKIKVKKPKTPSAEKLTISPLDDI